MKRLWKNLCIAGLLSSCSTVVPDIEVVTPISGVANVAALARTTNSSKKRRLTLDQWLDFLYAREGKGPAICVSSEDFQLNETTIAQLCMHLPCDYDQKKAIETASQNVDKLIQEASKK